MGLQVSGGQRKDWGRALWIAEITFHSPAVFWGKPIASLMSTFSPNCCLSGPFGNIFTHFINPPFADKKNEANERCPWKK